MLASVTVVIVNFSGAPAAQYDVSIHVYGSQYHETRRCLQFSYYQQNPGDCYTSPHYCKYFTLPCCCHQYLLSSIQHPRCMAVHKYSRLSLSRNRRDPQKHFEMSVLQHIRFVILRKKQFEQPYFTNDYVI